eukprot:6213830-Pleurochrysis_carterae.AAC.3
MGRGLRRRLELSSKSLAEPIEGGGDATLPTSRITVLKHAHTKVGLFREKLSKCGKFWKHQLLCGDPCLMVRPEGRRPRARTPNHAARVRDATS